MNRLGRSAILLFLGAVLARLLVTGTFGWFVQQRMRWPLIGAMVMLIVLGGWEAWHGMKEEREAPEAAKRAVAPVVGWMMVLPLIVLVMVAPTGLGAAAADRVDAFVPTEQTSSGFDPLPEGEPIEMSTLEFLDRAIWDKDRSLEGRLVRLEGLVVNDTRIPDGFRLTKFSVSCCAADGIPLQVALHDTGAPLDNDSWVIADVVWRPPAQPFTEIEGEWLVAADVRSLEVAPDGAPNDPYESPYGN